MRGCYKGVLKHVGSLLCQTMHFISVLQRLCLHFLFVADLKIVWNLTEEENMSSLRKQSTEFHSSSLKDQSVIHDDIDKAGLRFRLFCASNYYKLEKNDEEGNNAVRLIPHSSTVFVS